MRNTQLIVSLCLLLLAGCCRDARSLRTEQLADAWLTAGPDEEFSGSDESHIVPEQDVAIVPAAARTSAEALLERKALIGLDDKTAALLLGNSWLPRKGLHPFLVRGVRYDALVGDFQCRFYRGMLWVSFGAMGSHETKMRHAPLVVFLKDKPRRVFVGCYVME